MNNFSNLLISQAHGVGSNKFLLSWNGASWLVLLLYANVSPGSVGMPVLNDLIPNDQGTRFTLSQWLPSLAMQPTLGNKVQCTQASKPLTKALRPWPML